MPDPTIPTPPDTPDTADTADTAIRAEVRDRYAAAAQAVTTGQAALVAVATDTCCGGSGDDSAPVSFGAALYPDSTRADLPPAAVAASLGCGNPLAVADLREGETVLDLGSGGGGDVLLSARRVGPTGRVYGLDMTDEMLALARRNVAEAGATNVELRKGHIEAIPLPEGSIDVVISNCVVNLSTDKPAVFAQIYRVLRSGGRIGITDVVAEDTLNPAERAERGDWVGCVAGALSRTEYLDGLAAAGFTDLEVTFTHQVADRMHSAIIKAIRP